MDIGKVKLIDLVAYEIEQRKEEDGTISDENWKYVEALQSAVSFFYKGFGHYYWDDAIVEKHKKRLDNGGTEYIYILTSDKQQIPQKRFSFII